jgi:hypothetical protein
MMLCETCQKRDALVSLQCRDARGHPVATRDLCPLCWAAAEPALRPTLHQRSGERSWVVEIRDPATSEVRPEAVEYFIALERAADATVLAAAAEGLVHFVMQSRRRLPTALEGFVRRHWRPASRLPGGDHW